MPTLTVRALAEMMQLPVYEQVRILHEQKYPRQTPQSFRVPYYLPALRSIRQYYTNSNDRRSLRDARSTMGLEIGNEARLGHNRRVLDAFEDGPQATRRLSGLPVPNLACAIGETIIKLSFDFAGAENEEPRYIFYNCRNADIGQEIARTTLEISAIVLRELDIAIPPDELEYIDLYDQAVYTIHRPRRQAESRMRRNIDIIETLWPTI
jgi:hypothetical protein